MKWRWTSEGEIVEDDIFYAHCLSLNNANELGFWEKVGSVGYVLFWLGT